MSTPRPMGLPPRPGPDEDFDPNAAIGDTGPALTTDTSVASAAAGGDLPTGPRRGPAVVREALAGRVEQPRQRVARKVVVPPPRREECLGDDVVDGVGPGASRDEPPYSWVVTRKERRERLAIGWSSGRHAQRV